MKTLKTFGMGLLAAGMVMAGTAQAQYSYTTNADNTITITRYTGPGGAVSITNEINGLVVTSIGDQAFFERNDLTSVTIPINVISIGIEAFFQCTSLTNATIPNSVTSIDALAFYDCTSLSSVTIPGSAVLGYDAFYYCTGLTEIYFEGNAPGVDPSVFEYDNNATVYYLPGTIGWGNTLGGLTTMVWNVFSYTTNSDNTITITGYFGPLDTVTIPATINGLTVSGVESNTFQSCTNLTSVTILAGITNIGDYAFYDCTSLTSVYFQCNAPSVGGTNVFNGDTNVVVYYLLGTTGWSTTFGGATTALWTHQLSVTANPAQGGTVTGSGTYAVGTNVQLSATASSGWLFYGWNDGTTNSLYNITMPESNVTYTANFGQFTYATNNDGTITITGYSGSGDAVIIPSSINGLTVSCIGGGAFYDCTNLTSIIIPDSVTNIGNVAFASCTNLTSVIIPNCITSIGVLAFDDCTSLTNVTIPNGVTSIGDSAFVGCDNLTSVTIPDSVISLGMSAFGGCFGLTNAIIGNGVTNIPPSLFGSCRNLTNIIIPNSVINIGESAFENCGLTSVTIPDSVTIIGDWAFNYCTSLTTVVIGNGVTNIGRYVFSQCPNLTNVYFTGNVPLNIDSTAFLYDTNPTAYYLPGTTGWTNFTAVTACPTSIWLPQISAACIQSNAFSFNINWASGMVAVVESCTNLVTSSWQPVQTNNMQADTVYFSDPNWTNNPACFYRVVWQ
jgi:hypothetical protein